MLEDKFVEYISGIKSPYDEQDVNQEDISFDGYMQYFRDCMLHSIGTKESSTQFSLYWDEFLDSCDEPKKEQFIQNCLNRIITHYEMSYLSADIDQGIYQQKDFIELISFYVYRKWLKYFPKCLSFISNKLLNNESSLQIFLTSDYDNFVDKLLQYKRCPKLISEYYKNCSKLDGVKTLLLTLKDDLLTNFVEQYKIQQKVV